MVCRWVLLISHPQDFTPVCTTELGYIARAKQEFSDRNVKVLAHSVDDLQSHIEWVKVSMHAYLLIRIKCDVKFFLGVSKGHSIILLWCR